MAGHSPSKTGVNALSPAIDVFFGVSTKEDVDARHKARSDGASGNGSRAGALAAARTDIDGAVRDGEAERGSDRALDQADLAAMRAHQFPRDRKAEPGAATPGRALEGFEQVGARLLR